MITRRFGALIAAGAAALAIAPVASASTAEVLVGAWHGPYPNIGECQYWTNEEVKLGHPPMVPCGYYASDPGTGQHAGSGFYYRSSYY
ncbi:hypothetical protein [Amycolatopsis sp. NPDC102389]|uniref:hypothetical protein n=1 Tax=Amycolatopsis sp. NPDC102389 TaxID=3363941 RepID=UPI0037FC9A97